MARDWIDRGREALIALADGRAWPYRRGGPVAAEATALAGLGLLATSSGPADPAVVRGGEALLRLRRPDGSVVVVDGLDGPAWATPHAILLWRALDASPGARRAATAWLLGERVDHPPLPAPADRLTGHDTSIAGWPWVEGTHSWVEPTALAVLALGAEGRADAPRAAEGLRLLRDRAIPAGGWNYGNNLVFGRPLRPQPGPTGLALLALARLGKRTAAIDRAIAYLLATLPRLRAAISLGSGLLGLRAWGVVPAGADAWLAESAGSVLGRDDAATRLGLLLLAAGERTPAVLGQPTIASFST